MHLAVNATFWNEKHTGSGQYVRHLVSQLDRLVSDLEITLVYPSGAGRPPPADAPPGVRLRAVPARAGSLGKLLFEQWGFPRACAALGVDLAHVPYWGSPLRAPVPTVVTVHDLINLRFREYRRRHAVRLYTALVSAAAQGADHVITDSDASRQEIIEHLKIAPQRVTAVPLGVSPRYAPPTNSLVDMATLQKYRLPDFYVLYLGGFERHKNVTTLLEAYSYVGKAVGEDYPLVLAGHRPAPSPHRPDYDALIDRLGIAEYVRWIGFVDEADKPAVMRNAQTFVYPSRYEGFGLPVLEALASGVPVVTTDAASLPEVVGSAGFAVDPDSPRDMAGAIIATIVEESLAAELRAAGPRRAADFTWEKTALATLDVYLAVAGD